MGLTAVNFANVLFSQDFGYYLAPTNEPDIVFQLGDVPSDVVTQVAQTPNVTTTQLRTQFLTHWRTSASTSVLMAVYSYPDSQHIRLGPFQLLSGHLPGPGEVVLASRDQFMQPAHLGDTIYIENQYEQPVALRIVGFARTAETTSYTLQMGVAYVSSGEVHQLVPNFQASVATFAQGKGSGSTNQLLIQTHDISFNGVHETHDILAQLLSAHHIPILGSSWNDPSDNASSQLTVSGLIQVAALLSAFALLLVCIMILNMVTMVLTEQLQVIGTMKALGGTRWHIVRSYLITIGIYAVIGTALGIGLGILLFWQLSTVIARTAQIDPTPLQVNYIPLVVSIAAGLLTPLVSALIPLWLGTRITVREAMASYGVSAGETRPQVWSHALAFVPQTVWLGFRGVFRHRLRAGLTILALVIAAGAFASIQISNATIAQAVIHSSRLYGEDFRVDLGDYASQPIAAISALAQIQTLPNIQRAEAIDDDLVTVSNRELLMTGLNAQTQLYHYHLVTGRWLKPEERGSVVLSDAVAGNLHLRVGQQLVFYRGRATMQWLIVGIVHEGANASGSADTTGRLGMAFTTLSNLNALRHLPADASSHIWVLAHDQSSPALSILQQRLQSTLNRNGLRFTNIRQDYLTGLSPASIIAALFDTVAIVVALVGLLSLSNTIAASALERRREIGILRSLGASGGRIGLVFWLEALALSLLAWAIGTALGIPGGYGIISILQMYIQPFDVVVNPTVVGATLVFIIVVSLVSSFGPALAAARVRIQEVLRYE